ncbi:hypothetical protein BDN72DRAFT_879180 [Pluteus cervinus]|uniref:Uncharacterized protein n=1 Tax=Pluteus cervinus TaxID=181527 RepID=A0ACD3ARP8_9AGAR|nr:hypothetical protein BDN72DRAFT_879180 [Pluteus cervinus]
MLGTRTKQINTYGKRNQRIVAVSEPRERLTDTTSIFEEPPVTHWAPVASRMRKRENDMVPVKVKTPSPKVIRIQKKKRLSPVFSPVKRKTRIIQIVDDEIPSRNSQPAGKGKGKANAELATPTRTPLASFSVNLPASPAIMNKPRPKPSKKAKGTPLRPPAQVVEVDIIILDDDGVTISKERRVSRTNAEIQPIKKKPTAPLPLKDQTKSRSLRRRPIVLTDSESDNDEPVVIAQPTRRVTRRPLRIESDESESEKDVVPPPPACETEPIPAPKPLKAKLSSSKIEVVIPQAPYVVPKPQARTAPRPASPHRRQTQLPSLHTLHTFPTAPSPPPRPRRLTPIKRGARRNQPFEPPSPVTPTTPTDLDLSLDFSGLNIDSPSALDASLRNQLPIPAYLHPLLEECGQEEQGPYEFSAFIDSFPFDPVVQSHKKPQSSLQFRKIGEASYSEVFGIGDVVLKIIPLRNETREKSMRSEDMDADEPAPSDAKDVRKEIIVTRAMGDVCDGFVRLLKTYVVRGKYPDLLLNLWDDYNETKGSESVRPDTFTASQVYAIIVLPNGGLDLENYTFTNGAKTGWRQACSIFWQVAKALAHAEQLVSFEHRDLHWGQILVKNLPGSMATPLRAVNLNQVAKPKSRRLFMDDAAHGVRATLIDLGLARMDAGDGSGGERVHWTPLEEEIFMGSGDYQFDVYRLMRDYNIDNWVDFNPFTNVMWLHYLSLKLLQSKRLKPPSTTSSRKPGSSTLAQQAHLQTPNRSSSSGTGFSEKECYDSLLDIENWLKTCISGLSRPKPVAGTSRGRRKTQAPMAMRSKVKPTIPSDGPSCAGEVVAYAVKKGWIKALSSSPS